LSAVLLSSIALASSSVCWGIRIHGQRRIVALSGAALLHIIVGKTFRQGPIEKVPAVFGDCLFACGQVFEQGRQPKNMGYEGRSPQICSTQEI
jgi:hypothetical protein